MNGLFECCDFIGGAHAGQIAALMHLRQALMHGAFLHSFARVSA